MTLNTELLNRTNDLVQDHPELHDQSQWSTGSFIPSWQLVTEADLVADPAAHAECGSTGCFAGWAAVLGGWHQLRGNCYTLVVDETGTVRDMRSAAIEALGIGERQAEALFCAYNSRATIDEMVADLTANPNVEIIAPDADPDRYDD